MQLKRCCSYGIVVAVILVCNYQLASSEQVFREDELPPHAASAKRALAEDSQGVLEGFSKVDGQRDASPSLPHGGPAGQQRQIIEKGSQKPLQAEGSEERSSHPTTNSSPQEPSPNRAKMMRAKQSAKGRNTVQEIRDWPWRLNGGHRPRTASEPKTPGDTMQENTSGEEELRIQALRKMPVEVDSPSLSFSVKEMEALPGYVLSARRLLREDVRPSQAVEKRHTRGREVKRVHEQRPVTSIIPDVSLSSTSDYWSERERKRTLLDDGAQRSQELPALFGTTSGRIQAQREKVATQLAAHHPNHRHRRLEGHRSNGVSEMPDPEAAEYLAKHESGDLGKDVLNAAVTHYNGTQGGSVHPLSTDSQATREEHVTETEASVQSLLHEHLQNSEAVVARYAGMQESQDEEPHKTEGLDMDIEDESSSLRQSRSQTPRAESQKGYPWYAQFPPPSFPHRNLTKTNLTIHTELKSAVAAAQEEAKKSQEALLAANAQRAEQVMKTSAREGPSTVALMARDNMMAEKSAKASIWASHRPKGPGDGGELPPGSYIVKAAGSWEQTEAGDARERLRQQRAQSRVWMSLQEASLIESYLDAQDVMLEFGAGYSTMWFSQFVKDYYSIEHNETWFNVIKAQINATRKNVHLQVAPVEKGYKGWGGGFEEGTYQQFEHYVKAVDNFKVTRFDKVLVDGRARAFCLEYVLKFLHPKSLVFIHDYQDRYFYHGTAEQFYQKVAETYEGQSLAVLRPKPEALKKAAMAAVASLATS